MHINRRQLLQGIAASAAAGPLAAGPLGCASNHRTAPRHLIVMTAYGGWDTTWSFDPKPGVPGIDVGSGELSWFAEIPFWTHENRPVARRFFEQFAHRCAVVNGVSVRSISHTECMRRVLTGTATKHSPDLGAIVGVELGADRPVPYLVLGDMSYPGTLEASTGRVGPSNQLATLADTPSTWHPDDDDEDAIRAFVEARVARERAIRGSQGENRARMNDFLAALGKSDQLVERAGDLGGPQLMMGMDAQRELALRALETGLSSAVSLSSGVTFDTHTDNDKQGYFHEQLFGNLELLLTDLEARSGVAGGATMLDETLVMVCTEMGRTPLENAQAGKDHWPWGSAMLFGAGLRGGRVYGATDDTFQGVTIDYATGNAASDGQIVENGNVAAGILSCMGVDPSRWLPDEPFDPFVERRS